MSVFVFKLTSPGSDLDGEEWVAESTTLIEAAGRISKRIDETFALAGPERIAATTAQHVATYPSRRAMEKAMELADTLPAPADSATRHRHDFRDGDVCSTCDAVKVAS